MTSVRKSLHQLQEAAGDKENLVGPGRMPQTADKINMKGSLREVNENHKASDAQAKLVKRKITSRGIHPGVSKKGSSSTVTEEDLCKETPSEKYWESLAEERRVALATALSENEELYRQNEELRKKVTVLQDENRVRKELLQESETLVEVLKEMIGGDSTNDESGLMDNSLED